MYFMEMRDFVKQRDKKSTNMEINSEKDIFENTGNYQKDVKHSKQSIEELKVN